MEKRYGLLTSIALVVGIVIGSGVFFKADDVLTITKGNVVIGLLAWFVGALIMVFGSLTFAEFAGRYEKSNGLVDYFEIAYGKFGAFLMGWFQGNLYYSALAAILSFVSSLYTLTLLGFENPGNSTLTWILSFTYMTFIFALNYLSPKLAGKFQISTTLIKLIPLALVAIFGIIFGFKNGVTAANFNFGISSLKESGNSFSSAIVSTAFAYEGWIIATTLNQEIKDSKKNLPKALVFGSVIITIVYIAFFLGMTGVMNTQSIVMEGDNAVYVTITNLFNSRFTSILVVFLVISCLGTTNGLIMSCIRVPYSLAIRGEGIRPDLLSKVNEKTKMPFYATLQAYIVCLFYLFIWYGSLDNMFGRYIALDEIPIVSMYVAYLFLYVFYIKNFKDLTFFSRYVKPVLAGVGACVILYGGISNPALGQNLLISIFVLLIGAIVYFKPLKKV
jgi:APA family basic amino acid/polyamine antiporter